MIEEAWNCFSKDSPSKLIEYTPIAKGAHGIKAILLEYEVLFAQEIRFRTMISNKNIPNYRRLTNA